MGKDPTKNLTTRQLQVYWVLDDAFRTSLNIASKAGIRTTSPGETAAKYCIQLVKLGLAEKGGTPMFPMWRRALEKIGGGDG